MSIGRRLESACSWTCSQAMPPELLAFHILRCPTCANGAVCRTLANGAQCSLQERRVGSLHPRLASPVDHDRHHQAQTNDTAGLKTLLQNVCIQPEGRVFHGCRFRSLRHGCAFCW